MTFEFTNSNFEETALGERVVLIHFCATWGGPCRGIAPTIEELAADYKGRALVGKLDVDANPEIRVQFGSVTIPTLFILSNGVVIDRSIGLTTKQVLANKLDAALANT